MHDTAIALANGLYDTVFAKTTHGLVRGPSRYPIVGVVDARFAGQDAGVILDGKKRDIPIFASLAEARTHLPSAPSHCIVGVATVGGLLPVDLYEDLQTAATAGMTLVNGLHQQLSKDPILTRLAQHSGARFIDIRKPRPAWQLSFWSGDVRALHTPRIAVLGMDCAIGKRTTCMLLRDACRKRGIHAQMIYTGQTGWLQGLEYGFIFDATLNDFVSGELERAILTCNRETQPDVILMEGQSALRNPAGPAGSELLLSGDAHGVILQHAPQRQYFEDFEDIHCAIPDIREEIELIRLFNSELWAVSLYTKGMTPKNIQAEKERLSALLNIPVVAPITEGVDVLVDVICNKTGIIP